MRGLLFVRDQTASHCCQQRVVGLELLRAAFEDDAAVAHHADARRDLQRDRQLLLDQHAPRRRGAACRGCTRRPARRSSAPALRWVRRSGSPAGCRAASGRSSASAARRPTGCRPWCCGAPSGAGSSRTSARMRPALRAGHRRLLAHAQVLVDRQVGEDLALLGHVGQAGAADRVRLGAGERARRRAARGPRSAAPGPSWPSASSSGPSRCGPAG